MKKIIAISVMLVLIAGAVFAETAIGGGVETRFSIAQQMANKFENDYDKVQRQKLEATLGIKTEPTLTTPDPLMLGGIGQARLSLSGSNADGSLGGTFRWRNDQSTWFDQVFVWWKPIQQVKVFLGIDQDGLFDTADFCGWAFHAGDNDYLFNHHWDLWRQVFPGNWDGFGLAFSFYPIPGLDINLVLPTGNVGYPQAASGSVNQKDPISNTSKKKADGTSETEYNGMIPGRLRFSANYSLDFGKISFVYIGGVAAREKGVVAGADIDDNNNGLVGLNFLVTALEGMQIKVGGSVVLNKDSAMLMNFGIGYAWTGDGFGVKVRGAMIMQGDDAYSEIDYKGKYEKDAYGNRRGGLSFITGNVMPYIKVGESGEVSIDIGITMDTTKVYDKDDDLYKSKKAEMGWYVTPAYRLGLDGGAFKVGIQLFNNTNSGGNVELSGQDYVKWNIPMSLSFSF